MSLAKVPTLFKCVQCGMEYNKRSALRLHIETHRDKPLKCTICGKEYNKYVSFQAHMRMHSDKLYTCDQCGKNYNTHPSLWAHMQTHSDKLYECDECGKKYKKRGVLLRHKQTVHAEAGQFECDECGKQYKSRSAFRTHMETHSGKQHGCDQCEKKCVSLSALYFHKRSAHGEAGQFECGECGKEYTKYASFRSHMETHSGKLHECDQCDMKFARASNLKRHNAAMHQGERRFKCDDCGYISNYKLSFTRHQKSCKQGRALGNMKLKQAGPAVENLEIKNESPRGVYQFGSKIGEGGFGKVYEAVKKSKDPRVKYAIKEVGPKGGKSAELEAKRMRQFDHKNLMTLIEYYECEKGGRLTRFIVMECCLPGSLTIMQKLVQFQFEEPHVLYVLKEVACGLEHLHSAGVIHRDLKSANVLVNERAEVKIADFGVSTADRIAFNCRGTPGWVAPEVVDAALTGITGLVSAYTQTADVYSFGVLAIDLFLPRETLPTDFFHKKKVESESFAEIQLQRIEDDRNLKLSKAFRRLVTGCLAPMTTRLSAAAVQKVMVVKNASVEPFKELVAECVKKQKGKEEIRRSRKRKATTDTEASSRSGPATQSSAATRLFTTPTDPPHQPSTSGGMSSLFSAKSAITHQGQPTASSSATTLFSADDDAPQQPSTSGGMSSLFATSSSRPDHEQLPVSHQTLRPDEY